MPHSLGQVYVHLVVATKDGVPLLVDGALRADLHAGMAKMFRTLGCPTLRVGGANDHVHVLFRLSRVRSIADVVAAVKEQSSAWMRDRSFERFDWEDGYCAFSVSTTHVDRVVGYIRNQEPIHHDRTFAEEYREMVEKCGGFERRVEVQLIFSTRNRYPYLTDPDLRQELHAHLRDLSERAGCPARSVGGVKDHVHILCRLSHDIPLAILARDVKKGSTTRIAKHPSLADFDWQNGYGAFSVSPQHVPAVCHYIENQEAHHLTPG